MKFCREKVPHRSPRNGMLLGQPLVFGLPKIPSEFGQEHLMFFRCWAKQVDENRPPKPSHSGHYQHRKSMDFWQRGPFDQAFSKRRGLMRRLMSLREARGEEQEEDSDGRSSEERSEDIWRTAAAAAVVVVVVVDCSCSFCCSILGL